jgi:plasmid maintenance system antidote protein VapI
MNHSLNRVKIEILKNFATQSDFAYAAGVHESKVSQVLNGRRKLSKRDATKWSKILKCDPRILNPVTQQ